MNREEEFENTFAPARKNRRLAAGEIVAGMRFVAFKYGLLPPRVRKAVDEEAKRQRKEGENMSHAEEPKWGVGLLKAVRDLERRRPGAAPRGRAKAPRARRPSARSK